MEIYQRYDDTDRRHTFAGMLIFSSMRMESLLGSVPASAFNESPEILRLFFLMTSFDPLEGRDGGEDGVDGIAFATSSLEPEWA